MNLPRVSDSVSKVESEQDAKQAEKAQERKGNQPIKSQESYMRGNERKFSAVQNLIGVNVQRGSKTTQNNSAEVVDKINESYLSANYEADKMLQKLSS